MQLIAGKPSWSEVYEDTTGNRYLWRTILDLSGQGLAIIRNWRDKCIAEGLNLTDEYEVVDLPSFQGRAAIVEVWLVSSN